MKVCWPTGSGKWPLKKYPRRMGGEGLLADAEGLLADRVQLMAIEKNILIERVVKVCWQGFRSYDNTS